MVQRESGYLTSQNAVGGLGMDADGTTIIFPDQPNIWAYFIYQITHRDPKSVALLWRTFSLYRKNIRGTDNTQTPDQTRKMVSDVMSLMLDARHGEPITKEEVDAVMATLGEFIVDGAKESALAGIRNCLVPFIITGSLQAAAEAIAKSLEIEHFLDSTLQKLPLAYGNAELIYHNGILTEFTYRPDDSTFKVEQVHQFSSALAQARGLDPTKAAPLTRLALDKVAQRMRNVMVTIGDRDSDYGILAWFHGIAVGGEELPDHVRAQAYTTVDTLTEAPAQIDKIMRQLRSSQKID